MKRKNQEGQGVIIALIVVAVIALGGFVAYKKMRNTNTAMTTTATETGSPTSAGSSGAMPTSNPTATPTKEMAPTSGNTDADLNQDSADVTTKLNALNSDATSIDAGLNDQQGNLSEQ